MDQMRNMLVLSAAASALALGVSMQSAAALSPGTNATGSDGLVQKVQRGDETGAGSRGQGGAGGGSAQNKGGDQGAAQAGGKGASEQGAQGGASAQNKGGDQGAAQAGGKRASEQGARGGQHRGSANVNVGGGRGEKQTRRSEVNVNIHRPRGERTERRTRIGVEADHRRRGGREIDIYGYGGRSYGYGGGSCQDILRRYRQCIGR
jgi:hypothetical protein